MRAELGAALTALALVAACSSSEDATGTTTPTTEPTAAASAEIVSEVFPLGGRPSAVAVGDGIIWVADDGRGVIVGLDPTGGHQITSPIEVGPEPIALSVDADGRVWVADAGGLVHVIELRPRDEVDVDVVQVDGTLVDVVALGDAVFVADIEGSRVVRLDLVTRTLTDAVPVPDGAVRLAASSDRLWVTNLDRTVTPIDIATLQVDQSVEVGAAPIGISVDVRRDTVWVANSESNSVVRLDEAGGRPVGEPIPVGAAPVDVASDGRVIWIVEQDGRSISRVDGRTGVVEVESSDVGTRPRAIASGPSSVWVVGVDPSVAVRLTG